MIVKKLKPYVNYFSAAIQNNCKHGDVVRVGGKIVSVLDLGGMLEEQTISPPIEEGVYITLDDGVGLNHIVVQRKAYLKCAEKFNLKEGSVVVADGRVFQLKMQQKGKKIEGHPDENQSLKIFCWSIMPIPEDKLEEEMAKEE